MVRLCGFMNQYHNKLQRALKGRIFIYIDAANLERSVQDMWVDPKDVAEPFGAYAATDLRYRVDYEKLQKFFAGVANLQDTKFYSAEFATPGHQKFLWFLKKVLKFSLATKPLKEYDDHTAERPHRKANFDVEIAVDAVFHLDDYDTLVLFSGDCDFEYLLKFLRGRGKLAIVFSRAGHIAKELPPASSYYFDIVDFRHEFLNMTPKKAKNPA